MSGGLIGFAPSTPHDAAGRYAEGLPTGATVAVALSGGGDSVGLLVALRETASFRAGRIRLVAVTVDHGLRAGSAGEAAAMADFCGSLSVPHLTMKWQGEKPETGLSAAARAARYHLLAEAARRLDAGSVVTAHTLDDQLETVEMRRQRGEAGGRGLAGIAPSALFFGSLAVHRPFLTVSRADIRAYLAGQSVGWIDDPSNDNLGFERVRVRRAACFAFGAEEIAGAARARRRLARRAAEHLAVCGRMPIPMLFAIEQTQADDEVVALALAVLTAVAGGQMHLPGQEQIGRLLVALKAECGPVAASLGRAVVERRKQTIHVCRDRRNLPVLSVPPNAAADWDGRFRVFNRDKAGIVVGPAKAGAGQEGVPPRIARRALATLPQPQLPDGKEAIVTVQPLLAPFETVLSSFDLELAQQLCRLTGRPVFPDFVHAGLETSAIKG